MNLSLFHLTELIAIASAAFAATASAEMHGTVRRALLVLATAVFTGVATDYEAHGRLGIEPGFAWYFFHGATHVEYGLLGLFIVLVSTMALYRKSRSVEAVVAAILAAVLAALTAIVSFVH